MGKLKTIINLILAVATPETVAIGKAILTAAAGLGSLLKDDGTPATTADLDAIWDECVANFRTLKSEREASNARIAADIAAGR
jgi:hypothetical protein